MERWVVTATLRTLSPSPTTRAVAWPLGSRLMPCCGASRPFWSTASSSTARTYMPGSRVPSGLGNSARKVTEPVASSTATSLNLSLPVRA